MRNKNILTESILTSLNEDTLPSSSVKYLNDILTYLQRKLDINLLHWGPDKIELDSGLEVIKLNKDGQDYWRVDYNNEPITGEHPYDKTAKEYLDNEEGLQSLMKTLLGESDLGDIAADGIVVGIEIPVESSVEYDLASEIYNNIKDENGAIEKYMQLLNHLPEEDRPIVEEIVSDEKNHREVLKALADKYDGNIPTAED